MYSISMSQPMPRITFIESAARDARAKPASQSRSLPPPIKNTFSKSSGSSPGKSIGSRAKASPIFPRTVKPAYERHEARDRGQLRRPAAPPRGDERVLGHKLLVHRPPPSQAVRGGGTAIVPPARRGRKRPPWVPAVPRGGGVTTPTHR